jgi:acetyltransferase-like isoleucine patch superfamily enzyme
MLIKRTKIPYLQIILIGIWPGFVKKTLYRLKGYKIGSKVKIGFGSIISGKNVSIGHDTRIGFFTIIRGKNINLGNYINIGSFTIVDTENIDIGDDSRINEQVIIGGLRTPESSIKLGKRTIVMEYSFINPTKPITIGDDTGIGGHCLLFTHGSWLNQLEGYPVTFEPITIGKNVWLPWRVFVLPGTTIGDNVVIGANSLVSRTIPSNVLIAGSPAKIIKENYPEKPLSQQREKILQDILKDFKAHLTYYGYEIKTEPDGNTMDFSVSKKSIKWCIQFVREETEISALENSVVIIDNAHPLIEIPMKKNSMVLYLHHKQRKGSSDVGEELVKFLSRYGIRFDRID